MQMDLIRQQLEFEAQHIRSLMEERFGTSDEMVQRAQVRRRAGRGAARRCPGRRAPVGGARGLRWAGPGRGAGPGARALCGWRRAGPGSEGRVENCEGRGWSAGKTE